MKKIMTILGLAVGCFIFSHTAAASSSTVDVIVKFKGEIDYSLIENYSHNYRNIASQTVALTIEEKQLPIISSEKLLEYVELDQSATIETMEQVWGYEDVQAPLAYESGLTGKGIKVGIIDTGIDKHHPDLVVAGGKSFVSYTTDYTDDDGHGTHIAGVIAAQKNEIGITGVAPNVELYALKAFNQDGESKQSDLVAAVEWGIAQGLHIMNLSFTSETITQSLEDAIKRAYSKGIFIVASAGNFAETVTEKVTDDVLYPARIPEVIAVGSINNKLQLSDFSYYGPSLDFVAPGEMIYSSYITNKSNYIWMSGTSMAAPYVVGSLALYIEAYPDKTIQEIESLAKEQSIDLGVKGFDSTFGYGLIQTPRLAKNTTNPANPFSDVEENRWYTDAILHLAKEKVITGYTDGTFKPDTLVSRAEAITMLMRVLKLQEGAAEVTFTDVTPGHFAYDSVAFAVGHDIIKGLPDGTFGTMAPITRADTAVIFQRAYQFEEVTESTLLDIQPFYYANSVHSLYAKGYITGYVDGTFKPLNPITRAEFANILYKIVKDTETTDSM